jgi:RNA polymerase sigma factor (sigma-70 family)
MSTVSTSATSAAADRSARLAASFERARDGDRGALNDVIRELNPLLWQVARAQGLSYEDAADVVQTAWLELVRHLTGIRSAQALTAWLVTTTRREAWRVRARTQRQVADDAVIDGLVDPQPGPADGVLTDERDQVLWRQFQRLSDRCRSLLRIVAEVDRPDYTVVAQALDMPHGSIGPTRGRCLAKLRQLLQDDPEWSLP